MKVDLFQNQTIDAMAAYMDRLSQRQQIVTSNLINIEVPGYKAKDISFHATMQELMTADDSDLKTSLPNHSSGSMPITPQIQAFEVQGLTTKPDGNNVDLDKEMMKLSETSFGYSMMTQFLRGKFRTLSMSINEGKA
jgi:flagellar basal-body rod protein FlgB